jgi:hypothetical protein
MAGAEDFCLYRLTTVKTWNTANPTGGFFRAQIGNPHNMIEAFSEVFAPIAPAHGSVPIGLVHGDALTRFSDMTKRYSLAYFNSYSPLTDNVFTYGSSQLFMPDANTFYAGLYDPNRDPLTIVPYQIFQHHKGSLRFKVLNDCTSQLQTIMTYSEANDDAIALVLPAFSNGSCIVDGITKKIIEAEIPYYCRLLFSNLNYGNKYCPSNSIQVMNKSSGPDNYTQRVLVASGEDFSFGTPTTPLGFVISTAALPAKVKKESNNNNSSNLVPKTEVSLPAPPTSLRRKPT